ncbi:unnamed protein product, partial [Rotaria sp. Silwood2]
MTFDAYLTVSVRDALQKNPPTTNDFILDCEFKFSSWELSKQLSFIIEDIIKDLPSQSNTINNDYLNMKKDLENKQDQSNQCQLNIEQIKNKILMKKTESTKTEGTSTTTNQTNTAKLQKTIAFFDPEYDDLTSKLTSYENEFIRLGEQLNYLNNQYHKIEQTRSTILDKALNASTKLQNEIQKLIKSIPYKFIQQHFQQSDAKQLNSLYQLLVEA